jgi:hypothetical protein
MFEDHLHERVLVTGKIGKLRHPLQHDPMPTLVHVINKMNGYSSAGRNRALKRASVPRSARPFFTGGWALCALTYMQAGFLTAAKDSCFSVSNAEGTYYRYLKLMMLGDKPR